MATITLQNFYKRQFGGAPPYGNVTSLHFELQTNSSGAALNSNSTAAIASGDVVVLGDLPAGLRLEDADAFVRVAMTAAVTGSLGFRYKDGVDSAEVPQDDAYFLSAKSLAATARLRADTAKLVTLPKDAELILTTGGANNAKASDIAFVVRGELTGPR